MHTDLTLPHDHPLLDLHAFTTTLPRPLADLPSPAWLLQQFQASPLPDDATRAAVRDLLRHSGFKPTGRSKPASEYLLKAAAEGWLGPDRSINAAVDACNLLSLQSGLPISIIDLDLTSPPHAVLPSPPGTTYIFNPAGQTLDASHLLALHDALGPCATPVKDAQRTKTHPQTTHTLTLIWGTHTLPHHAHHTTQNLQNLLTRLLS